MSKYRELFEADEWEWFIRLGKAKSDPEEKKLFFDGVIERKLADKNFSLFDAFPKDTSLGQRIGKEIVAQVSEINAKRKAEEKTFLPKRSGELAAWGESFGAVVDAELAKKGGST